MLPDFAGYRYHSYFFSLIVTEYSNCKWSPNGLKIVFKSSSLNKFYLFDSFVQFSKTNTLFRHLQSTSFHTKTLIFNEFLTNCTKQISMPKVFLSFFSTFSILQCFLQFSIIAFKFFFAYNVYRRFSAYPRQKNH